CRQTAVVGMRLAGDGWVVVHLFTDQLAEKFMMPQILDQVLYDRALADPADTVHEDNVFEALIHFRVFDDTHEWGGTRAGAQQVEPLARLQVVQYQRSRGLAADQNGIALTDVLQT